MRTPRSIVIGVLAGVLAGGALAAGPAQAYDGGTAAPTASTTTLAQSISITYVIFDGGQEISRGGGASEGTMTVADVLAVALEGHEGRTWTVRLYRAGAEVPCDVNSSLQDGDALHIFLS